MNPKLIATILLIFSTFYLSGQYDLSGKVLQDNKDPIAFANVLLLNKADSSLINGALANVKGEFSIKNIKKGSYLLSVSLINYESINKIISISADLDLGVITLKEISTDLDEVVVVAKKPLVEQKIDRMIINVQNNITAAGGTALEVLEKSPGVAVDRSRNLISLVGKEGVIIMINGKISRQPISAIMQMLSGMNANNIEKIELITNPPAKYEAGSNGGIINIQLLKSEDLGTNGNYSLTAGYGKNDKQGASININHRKNQINWYGDVAFNRNNGYEVYVNDRSVEENGVSFLARTISDRSPVTTNLNGRIGMDYNLGKNTTLGTFVSGFLNEWDMDAFNKGKEIIDGDTELFEVENEEKNQWAHLMGNINLQQKIGKSRLNFDLDYLYYMNDNPTDYINSFFNEEGQLLNADIIKASKETPVNIWISRVDLSNKISDKIKFDLGAKGTFSNLENNVAVEEKYNGSFIINTELSENAKLEEQITGVYGTLDVEISKKTQLNIGVRYEYAIANLDTRDVKDLVDLKYGEIFPSFFLSQEISQDLKANLSYGRRISRPTYNDLAPFVIFIDPNTYFFGNTTLIPSITNNIKLDFRYKTYLLSFQYNHQKDAIARYQPTLLEGTNQQVFTSINLDYKDTYTALLSTPVQLTKWWNIRINTMGILRRIRTMQGEELSADYVRLNGTTTFSLPKGFSIELNGFYQSESIFGIAKLSPYGNLSLGIQKKLSGSNKLRLTFDNIFGFEYDVFTAEGLKQNYSTNTNYSYEPRIFKLTFSSAFGNSKLKSSRKRDTGSEEIKRRVN